MLNTHAVGNWTFKWYKNANSRIFENWRQKPEFKDGAIKNLLAAKFTFKNY